MHGSISLTMALIWDVFLDRENEGAGGVSRRECGGDAASQRGRTQRLCGPDAPEW